MDITFSDWLLEEIEKREWTQSKLARKADISRQAISDYINQRRNPDNEALRNIARAFEISETTIFRIAGELSNNPDIDVDFEELKYLFLKMTEEEQEAFLAEGRLKIQLREQRERIRKKAEPALANR